MTRQSCESAVCEAQQRAIVALEKNPRAEQLQAVAYQARGSLAEGIGFDFGIQLTVFGFHDWLVLLGDRYGIADWRPELNWRAPLGIIAVERGRSRS
jgi:hypothetical protein